MNQTIKTATGITLAVLVIVLSLLLAGEYQKEKALNQEIAEMRNNLFYVAVGKIESDSDYCLNAAEIKAIQNTPVIDEYKNYLFESDAKTRANANKMSRNMINCE